MTINSYITDEHNTIVGEKRNPSFEEYNNCEKAVAYIKEGDVYQACDISDHFKGFQELDNIIQDRFNTLNIGVKDGSFFIGGETDDIRNVMSVYELINYLITHCKSLSEISVSFTYPGIVNTKITKDRTGNLINAVEVLRNFEDVIKNVELDQILENLTARQHEKEKKGFISSLRR